MNLQISLSLQHNYSDKSLYSLFAGHDRDRICAVMVMPPRVWPFVASHFLCLFACRNYDFFSKSTNYQSILHPLSGRIDYLTIYTLIVDRNIYIILYLRKPPANTQFNYYYNPSSSIKPTFCFYKFPQEQQKRRQKKSNLQLKCL